jgi:hypothetical protein
MTRLTNSQLPNHINPGYSNRVRVHATHDCEHDCHYSFTLYRGCTHSPRVVIILDSQAPVDLTEYLYTLLGCEVGHHYMAFQWLNLVCSVPAEVSMEVQSRSPRAPSYVVWFSGESTTLPTRSQPDGSIEGPVYPLHRLVRQTSLYHILYQAVPM